MCSGACDPIGIHFSEELLSDLHAAGELLYAPASKKFHGILPATLPYADTHTHLFSLDIPAEVALVRAALAGIRLMVVPLDPVCDEWARTQGVSELLAFIDSMLALARELYLRAVEQDPRVLLEGEDPERTIAHMIRFVVGVHPYGASEYTDQHRHMARELLAHPWSVGVGEIGLDQGPYASSEDLACQRSVFIEQLKDASKRALPVQLHIRESADDEEHVLYREAYELVREHLDGHLGCDLHCFTSDSEVAKLFAGRPAAISYGGACTFASNHALRTAAHVIDPQQILIETDAPYMTPVPLRGRRCEPAFARLVADYLAEELHPQDFLAQDDIRRAWWAHTQSFFVR